MNKPILTALLIAVGVAAWIASGQFGDDDGAGPAVESGAATASVERAATMRQGDPPRPSVRVVDSEAAITPKIVRIFGRTEADRSVTLRAETAAPVSEIAAAEGARLAAGADVLRLAVEDRRSVLDGAREELAYREIAYRAAEALSKKQFSSEVKLAEERAALAQARAAVAAARLDIERTFVKAPFDGVVDDIAVEVGDALAAGAELAYIADLDPIVVVIGVSERDIAAVEPGNRATVRLIGRAQATGMVRFVSRMGDPATRTFKVEIAVDNTDYAIAEGLTAEVLLETQMHPAHFITPAALTLDEAGRLGVMTVTAGDAARFMPVEIVRDEVAGIWVAGLPERIRIIVTGQEFVTDGQRVTPVAIAGAQG